jgi:hypothetical protein
VLSKPFANFVSHHLRPMSDDSLMRVASEGNLDGDRDLVHQPELIRIGRPTARGTVWECCINRVQTRELLRNTNVFFRPFHKDETFDAFLINLDNAEQVSRGTTVFPVGPTPKLGPDYYLLGLSEDNTRLSMLLDQPARIQLPGIVDSRDEDFWNSFFPQLQALCTDSSCRDDEDDDESSEVQRLMDALTSRGFDFPMVIKPSEGATSGSGVTVVRSLADFVQEAGDWFARDEPFILQQALKGSEEFTIHFTAHYGRLLSVDCFCSTFRDQGSESVFLKGNPKLGAVKPSNKGHGFMGCAHELPAIRLVERVVAGTLYNGLGCLQYKKDASSNGTPMIIELNPRLCSGITRDPYWHKVARLSANWVTANRDGGLPGSVATL